MSRQREYLADASSVELTRNPAGLERALAAIATDKEVLEVANRATQHLYFAEPDQEVRGALELDVLDPPADRGSDQPPPRADAASGRSNPGRRRRADGLDLARVAGLLALASPWYPPARRRADGSAGSTGPR